jgi:putative DNA primase/helicase
MVGTKRYDEGVYHHGVDKQEVNGVKVDVLVDRWILSVLYVLCIARTDSGDGHAYLIEYIPHGETVRKRAVISQSGLLGRGDDAMKELRDIGISVLGCNAKLVREYLDHEHLKFSHRKTPDDFWTSVKVIGWEPVGQRFVLPNEIIGTQNGVWFSGNPNIVPYKKYGTFDDWNTTIAERCEGNSYLMLALSCAFAGPLLEPLNIPGLGLHYFGDSTIGKSTALVVAASPWGSPKYMIPWRTTLNGLEIQAENHSSTLLVVDESHQVDAKNLDAAVYMLLNGMAKARMNRDTSARDIPRWVACVLSSGERSIETHQTTAKIEHKVGQTVRIIDVPVINGRHGIFEDIHGANNGAEFSDALRAAAAATYGHVGPLFIERLIANYSGLGLSVRLANTLKEFGNDLSAQDARVARSFAVAALAGELAIEWGILPWKRNSALIAAVEIFKHWQATQPKSNRSKEVAHLLKAILDFIQTYGARFSNIDWLPDYDNDTGRLINPEPVIYERAGYWKQIKPIDDDENGRRIYGFTAQGLDKASGGFGGRKAAEVLDAVGALVDKGKDKRRSKPTDTPDGNKVRLYWVDPEILEAKL